MRIVKIVSGGLSNNTTILLEDGKKLEGVVAISLTCRATSKGPDIWIAVLEFEGVPIDVEALEE